MKKFIKKSWALGLAGGGGLLLFILLLMSNNQPPPGGEFSVGLSSTGGGGIASSCTPEEQAKYAEVERNQDLLDSEISRFTNIEKRVPQTYEELNNSLFASVRPNDVLNPYTGQAVQSVTQPSAGDITWVYTPTPSLTVIYYYLCNGEVLSEPLEFSQETIQELSTAEWEIDPDFTTPEKYAYVVCREVNAHILLYWDDHQDHLPTSFQELLNAFPYIGKFRNEFTGGYAQNVPEETPSAGNFSYIYYPPQGEEEEASRLECYGENGRSIGM